MVCEARSTLILRVFRQREKFVVDLLRHDDRQERILEGVALEDIRERSADYRPEAELRQRPRGVLARTAAAEIVARQQNFRVLSARRVEDEIGLRIALRVIAPVAEELLVEAFFRGGLQEARRNDLVGIDVVVRHRNETGFKG